MKLKEGQMLQNKNEGKEEIRWSTKTTYIDIDSGEILTIEQVKNNYTKIKTKKNATVRKTTGLIEFTVECRESKQLKLF